jgi:hypothetical protein
LSQTYAVSAERRVREGSALAALPALAVASQGLRGDHDMNASMASKLSNRRVQMLRNV